MTVVIPYSRGELVSRLHLSSRIIELEYLEDGTKVTAMVRPDLAAELRVFQAIGI
jgi:GTP-binding protein HflX